MSEPAVRLRLLAAVGALACGAVAVAIVAVLAQRTPGPVASAGAAPQPAPVTFPAPPESAIVFSRQDGANVLALAVAPGASSVAVQVSAVDGRGEGVSGLPVEVVATDGTALSLATATPCGAGCYEATLSTARPRSITVKAGTTRWNVAMPKHWPPQPASALLARATRTFRNLRTLVIQDHLASDATHAVDTTWTIERPDKLTYQVENGPAAVLIGTKRWDKVPGGQWVVSAQTPLRQPTPFWKSWTNAYVLESTTRAWLVSFFDPKTPGWYELRIDKSSLQTVEMRMFAQAHFMHDVYGPFDEPVDIAPPR